MTPECPLSRRTGLTHRQLGSSQSRHPFGSATHEQGPNREQGDNESNGAESHALQDQVHDIQPGRRILMGHQRNMYSRQAASVASKSDLNISLISGS
jgi:hypothetical protein